MTIRIREVVELGVELGVVQRHRELAGDQLDRIEPFRGERAPDQAVLQQQHRPQRVAAEDGHRQHRTAVDIREVRVAGESVVAGGVVDHQRLAHPLCVYRSTDIGTTCSWPVPRSGRCRPVLRAAATPALSLVHSNSCTPVAPVIVLSTSTTRARSRSMLVSELNACDADNAEQVERSGRDTDALLGNIAGLVGVGVLPQAGIGPIELGDLGARPPGEVVLPSLSEQLVAGLFDTVRQ